MISAPATLDAPGIRSARPVFFPLFSRAQTRADSLVTRSPVTANTLMEGDAAPKLLPEIVFQDETAEREKKYDGKTKEITREVFFFI